MNNWKTVKLSTLCYRIGDGLHGTPNYTNNGDIFFINGNNIKDGRIIINSETKKVTQNELDKNFVELNDNSLLLSINGTLGSLAFYRGEKVMLGKSAAYLNFRSDINRFYYYYFQLKGIQKYFYDVATGSTIKNLALKSIQDFEVPQPEEEEYKKISSVLSTLDNKIELNNSINAELEQVVQTIYDYWFVQFDFPNENGKPYKSFGGKMVYNEILKREIPERWDVTVFNDWIEKTKTGDWGKDKIEGNYTERVYCVRGADINGLNGKGDIKAPERFILKNNLSKKLQPNDFIVEISGGSPTQSTARIALLTKESFERFDTNIVCSNFCKAITLKNETYAYNFQQEWQRLYDAGVFFGYEGKTSGIKNFLFDSFMDSYFIIRPPKELVLKFNSFAKEIEKKRQLNLQQNQELASLRDWLLPMLMNGQVKIKSDEISKDNIKVTSLNIPTNKKGFAKQVLAGKIVSEFKEDPNFTDIKFQKIQFLAEHIIEADLNLNYYYQAAGPYDNKFMHTIYTDFQKQKWFDCQNKKFIPLEKQVKIEGYYQGYFAPVQEQLNKLFQLMYQTSESESEIIATLYAVWNNSIIEGKIVKDNQLLEDFYQWSDRKLQYTKEQVFMGLQWLKENQMEPKGFGKLIKKAKNKK